MSIKQLLQKLLCCDDNLFLYLVLDASVLHFLKRYPYQNRLFAPLYASFLLLVLLLVVQGCLSLLIEVLHQQAFGWVTHSLQIERETERLLSSVLDEQTSVRGYLITGEPELLQPYGKANIAFRSSFTRLLVMFQDNPEQLGRLKQIEVIHRRWQKQFVQNVFAGIGNKNTLPGKTLFDPMREIVKTILQHEEKILEQRKQRLQQMNDIRTSLDILNLVAILAGIGWNLWLLHRRVELPLRQLTQVGQAWRAGQMDVRLDYSSGDEIGRLAIVLNAMAAEICDRQERSQMRNQQLQDLISALSHDLRTPLLATRNTLRPMLNGAFGPVSDSWKEILEEYRQANEQLIELVEALLDISRYEAGGGSSLNWEPLDWEKICIQAIHQIGALERQCPLNVKIAPLPTVYGDRIEIQRVLQNLLDNAVRVSEPDKPIIIDVAPLGVTSIQVAVRDRGPGISPQEKEKLFHRFIQGRGRRGGVGLGLYLCRQIVEAHGGTINVDSQVGEGSTFWFTLPVRLGLNVESK